MHENQLKEEREAFMANVWVLGGVHHASLQRVNQLRQAHPVQKDVYVQAYFTQSQNIQCYTRTERADKSESGVT